jgi:hypothetical protein
MIGLDCAEIRQVGIGEERVVVGHWNSLKGSPNGQTG